MNFREYGYKVADDALSWLFKNKNLNLPSIQGKLFLKGSKDYKTRATVSVTIKYTTEFVTHLSIHPKYGMYLLSAHVIKVMISLITLKQVVY